MKIVAFGEMLLRLAARSPGLMLQERFLETSFCGAELNVAVALAGFGHDTRFVTALPDNRLGAAARAEAQAFGIDAGAIQVGPGRMGTFYLTPGAMMRPSEILYDREGSAFARLDPGQFDWDAILAGQDWLFLSGITLALGDAPTMAFAQAVAAARRQGVRIAFDCNYRPALWRGREDQAPQVLLDASCQADLLFAGRRAVGLMLGRKFENPDPAQGFYEAAQAIFDKSDQISYMAGTRRTLLGSNHQRLVALLADRKALHVGEEADLNAIVDRVGTGDAFAAGIIHAFEAMPPNACLAFATGCSQWAHSVSGDFLRAGLSDIEGMISGSQDVKR